MPLDRLLSPIPCGDIEFAQRVWMAPLTRSRSQQPGDIPWDLNAQYYAQRANPETGAGLIIAEATQVSPQGKGYAFTPGIHTDEQVEGWKLVTDAVHAKGGKIFLQLWHVGRISHVDLQPGGQKPVAPSAIRAEGMTYTSAESGRVPVSEPRALGLDEIPGVVEQFRSGAANAKAAGFDGVEIHGANGYLLDQFLRSHTNKRTDAYGGPVERRARFCLEVSEAVIDVWGAGRVGYRVNPMGTFNSMGDDSPEETFGYLASELGKRGVCYIHGVEAFAQDERDDATERVLAVIRESFKTDHATPDRSVYVGNGGYTAELAEQRLRDGLCDAVAFGKLFISNPDLTARFRGGYELNEWNQETFYGGTAEGYTDYPALSS
ncbi:MAG: alkene reductase [Planctomycetota bacterium]